MIFVSENGDGPGVRLRKRKAIVRLVEGAYMESAMKFNFDDNDKPESGSRLGAYILRAAAIVLLVVAAIGFLKLYRMM